MSLGMGASTGAEWDGRSNFAFIFFLIRVLGRSIWLAWFGNHGITVVCLLSSLLFYLATSEGCWLR